MNLWTRTDRKNFADDVEALSSHPSGDRVSPWGFGVIAAAFPIFYGILCLARGHTTLWGREAATELTGKYGVSLAIAYIAAGSFLHFHFFWGLSERLWPASTPLKVVSLVVFNLTLFHAISGFFR